MSEDAKPEGPPSKQVESPSSQDNSSSKAQVVADLGSNLRGLPVIDPKQMLQRRQPLEETETAVEGEPGTKASNSTSEDAKPEAPPSKQVESPSSEGSSSSDTEVVVEFHSDSSDWSDIDPKEMSECSQILEELESAVSHLSVDGQERMALGLTRLARKRRPRLLDLCRRRGALI